MTIYRNFCLSVKVVSLLHMAYNTSRGLKLLISEHLS
nr:MAG TPA: hypothetical protein [Caudoviricetes sp.]